MLNALGERGVVVNIARGSAVDTATLAAALLKAALRQQAWMCTSEPRARLNCWTGQRGVDTHVAGWSWAVQASVDRFLENARRHLAGEPCLRSEIWIMALAHG